MLPDAHGLLDEVVDVLGMVEVEVATPPLTRGKKKSCIEGVFFCFMHTYVIESRS